MKRGILVTVIILVALATALVFAQEEKKEMEKKVDPMAEMKASIERGKKLFSDPKLGTNDQMCGTCHVAGGTKPGKLGEKELKAFDALNTKYPMYWMGAKRVMTLDQVVNWCLVNALAGKPLVWDDQKLTDLVAYCASVKPAPPEKKEKKE
jgi:cytochrome c